MHGILNRLAPVARLGVRGARSHVEPGPGVEVSPLVKIFGPVIIVSGIIATPLWVLLHLKEYRGNKAP